MIYYRFKFDNQFSKRYNDFCTALLDALQYSKFELFMVVPGKPAKLLAMKGVE